MEKKIILPRINFYGVRKLLLRVFAVTLIFSAGYILGVKGFRAEYKNFSDVKIVRETPASKNIDFSLFWQVWDTLGSKYFDSSKMNPQTMVYGAIQGMVAAVGDPYTMFLPPSENKVVDEDLSGSFEGVGIEIGYRLSKLAVISPIEGSPAEKAGIKPGDYIVHIKDALKNIDINSSNMPLDTAVETIRGKSGTTVTLTLLRDGSETPITVDIVRAKLDVPSVVLKYVGENESIAHIKINKFSLDTVSEWNDAVSKVLANSKVKGIVLDLRYNPGGYMQGAVDLASDFIPVGKTVVIEDRGNGAKTEYKVEKNGKLLKMPLTVLINGGSASASEILAGALRDQLKVKLVGEKSFGKGTIQEPVEITGGSGLHVTIAKWLTPNGTWVHEKGLEPDVKIENKEEADGDVQLNEAVKLLTSN